MAKIITLQPAERKDMTLPYPFFIDENGCVGRQEFWRGTPAALIGFAKVQTVHDVSLVLEDFLDHPEAAIGQYPVFAHTDGQWFTYVDPIAEIKINKNK